MMLLLISWYVVDVWDSWTLTPRFRWISWLGAAEILTLMLLCFAICFNYSMLRSMDAIIWSIEVFVSFIELLIYLVIWVVSTIVSSIAEVINASTIDRTLLLKLKNSKQFHYELQIILFTYLYSINTQAVNYYLVS